MSGRIVPVNVTGEEVTLQCSRCGACHGAREMFALLDERPFTYACKACVDRESEGTGRES